MATHFSFLLPSCVYRALAVNLCTVSSQAALNSKFKAWVRQKQQRRVKTFFISHFCWFVSLASTIRRVTHHAEVNMPIVVATSRVCKFHTCPIIVSPSLSSPLPSLFCAFSLTTHAPPLLAHPHRTACGAESTAALLRTCKQKTGQPAESDPHCRLLSSSSTSAPVYQQVSWDLTLHASVLVLDLWAKTSSTH